MRLLTVLFVLCAIAIACGSRSGELPPFDRDGGAGAAGGAGGDGGAAGGS